MRGRAGDLRAIKKKGNAAESLRRLKSYRDEQQRISRFRSMGPTRAAPNDPKNTNTVERAVDKAPEEEFNTHCPVHTG